MSRLEELIVNFAFIAILALMLYALFLGSGIDPGCPYAKC